MSGDRVHVETRVHATSGYTRVYVSGLKLTR